MLGIFDSGKGALAVLKEVRALYPLADICVLQDRENAPYGNKSENELTAIVKRNITRLVEVGASRVLIGCCTAATVYSRLGRIERQLSIPIIKPTAHKAAHTTLSRSVGVIATCATVRAHAFKCEITAIAPECRVTEIPAQELVEMVEKNEINYEVISGICDQLLAADIDTLVLGCTHFPFLSEVIGAYLPGVTLISCAEAAAKCISPPKEERGRTNLLLPSGKTTQLME